MYIDAKGKFWRRKNVISHDSPCNFVSFFRYLAENSTAVGGEEWKQYDCADYKYNEDDVLQLVVVTCSSGKIIMIILKDYFGSWGFEHCYLFKNCKRWIWNSPETLWSFARLKAIFASSTFINSDLDKFLFCSSYILQCSIHLLLLLIIKSKEGKIR